MEIIKNFKQWADYQKRQNNRVLPLEPSHKPEIPDSYPLIVVTNSAPNGYKIVFNHSFIYKKDAKNLLNS